ncbi:sodium/hydrogen exchanger 7-like isoform X2 [Lotus japonicus]|uniref:sodium/hydrogen exchanger 7-like isoform X2 n=1 Tax=Lotus japonicus TaxID=34305 RepID=UPI0025834AD6|nr:sodium/hydrogen exchanger 7-like isoform X2 [Lotus japonicus]
MAALTESLLPLRIMEEQPLPSSASASASAPSPSSGAESNPSDCVIFFGLCLALGIACRHLLRGTRVPYTAALLIIGIALGSIEYGTSHHLGKIGDGIRLWSDIDPELLLAVFLPALLFESSFSMEIHQIKRCMAQMILLAGPGVVLSTFFLGTALKLTFPYNWTWKTSLLLGGLLSATDPVAVVALLKELGASKKLSTIIEGESLMNDGTAIVVYTLFYRMVLGETFNWVAIIKFLAQVSLGAVGLGVAFGIASVLWLGFIFNDTVIEISLTVAVSYIAYFTAQEGADVSGVLTVMSLGMFYSAFARTAFKGESQQSLHYFWEMVAYIANTLIFILSGVLIAEGVLKEENAFHHGKSWIYLLVLYAYVQVSRCIVVGALFPFLRYFGYGLDWKEAIILVWSGLRGAVALSLSLSVKRRILDFTKNEMLNKALEAFGELGDDEELGPADWPTVKRYISCLNDTEGEHVHPHGPSEGDGNMDPMNLKDIRVRILNGVQAAYWEMLDEGRITTTTANILMLSVEEAIDLASSKPLCDWEGLKANIHFPNYYKFLQSSMLPSKLVTYFTVERLESACYICAAFLRAHRIARQQLRDFIGDSDVAYAVINESIVEGEEARKFLEDVHVTYPQVLRVVKTRQATYVVLNHLMEYVQNLEKAGILEEKEMLHLHDAVQTDLKKLLRNPPLVKLPKISNIHPMLGALPSSIRESLASNTKQVMKLRGLTLYKEGAKSNGIWLISNGVVKWESKMIRTKHPFYPTFTHGSTLGLYEVLTRRPYICNVITDSIVFCYFLEADKIISMLNSDPSLENFLWQESAIFLSKLLFPQKFEKLAMQDLRALIAERSEMTIYIRGETIEIPHHSVAFLLEGYVKTQGRQELVTAPATLLPSHGNQSFQNLAISGTEEASFTHQGSCYLVETRARVIVFDMTAFEVDAALVRRSSSRLSPAVDHSHRSFRREHSGLMSWPEHFFNQKRHKQSAEGVGQQTISLSEKAMQLSIYGSMVNIPLQRRSLSMNRARPPPPQSLSYPNMASYQDRPLTSVKSEGAATDKKGHQVTRFNQDVTNPPPQSTERREHHRDDSSDDSAVEEDIIVRVDSPSTLSFPHL